MDLPTRAAAPQTGGHGPVRGGGRAGASAVVAAAALAGAVLWGPVLVGGAEDEPATTIGALAPLSGAHPGAGEVVVAGGSIATAGLPSRRLQSFAPDDLAATGPGRTIGADGDIVAAIAAAGTSSPAVWAAVSRSGGGLLVRVDGAQAVSRVISTADLIPRRMAVLPGQVVVMGANRVAGVPIGAARPWSRALPSGVDVAVGYQSVWTLSRLPGARSLLARRDPGTGRVVGRRTLPMAATRLAVGLGAVWIANGCVNGVLRAPVGGGQGVCVRVGRDPAGVAVGGASAWAADASGSRVVEMDGATARVVRTWAVDGRPAAVAASGDVVAVVTRGGRAFGLAPDGVSGAGPGGSR